MVTIISSFFWGGGGGDGNHSTHPNGMPWPQLEVRIAGVGPEARHRHCCRLRREVRVHGADFERNGIRVGRGLSRQRGSAVRELLLFLECHVVTLVAGFEVAQVFRWASLAYYSAGRLVLSAADVST